MAEQVVGLRLEADTSQFERDLKQSGKVAGDLAGSVSDMGAKIDRALAGITDSSAKAEDSVRGIDDRMAQLTGADREVVLRANISQAEAGIRQIDQLLTDPTLTDAEIRIALDKRGEASRKIDELKEQLGELGPAAAEAGEEIERGLNLGAIGGAIGSMAVADRLDDAVTSTGQLRAQLGLTADEVRQFDDVAREVYRNNYGETMGEAARVTGMVHQSLGLVGDDLGDFTQLLLSVSDAFEPLGADSQILLEDVRAITANFPGTTEAEALDLIAHGFQTGAGNAGDLQDTLQEYPGDFARIGLDADDMIGIIVSGMDAGMRNTDMMADAVREMGIRISTAGDTGQKALAQMFPADEAQRLIRDISAGGEAGRTAFFQIMEGLLAIEDPQDRYNRAIEIMGSRGEEIINQLPRMRDGLTQVRDRTVDVGGAAEDTTVQYDGFRNQLDGIVRTIETSAIGTLGDVGVGFADVASNVGIAVLGMKGMVDIFPGLGRGLSGITGNLGALARGAGAFALAGVLVERTLNAWSSEMSEAKSDAEEMADSFMASFRKPIGSVDELHERIMAIGGEINARNKAADSAVNPFLAERHQEMAAALQVELDALLGSEAAASQLQAELGLTADEALRVATNQEIMGAAIDPVTGEIDTQKVSAAEAAAAHDALEQSIRGVNDALHAQFDPLFAAQDALLANEEAQRRVEEAGWAVTTASENYAEAVKREGEESWAARDAAHKLEEAQRDLDDANRDAQRSAIDVTTATNNLADRMRAGNIDIAAAEEQIRLWAEQGLITEEQARDMAEEIHNVALRADEIDGRTATLILRADISDLVAGLEEATLRVMGFNQAHGTNIPVYRGPGVQIEAARAEGGWVPGDMGEAVPILAHGREFVIRAEAANRLGSDVLNALNRGEMMPATYMAPPSVSFSASSAGGARAGTTIQQTNHIYGVHSTERTQTEELRRVQLMAP